MTSKTTLQQSLFLMMLFVSCASNAQNRVPPVCTLTALPASIFVGDSATLTASCIPAATSYTWTGGTCAGTNAASCTVSPSETTAYTVAGINDAGTGAAAVATVTVACTYSISPTSQSVAASGTTGTLSVASASGCAWTAIGNNRWIIPSVSSGSGNGTVDYAVEANPNSSSRTGTLTVAGQTFTVTQAGLVVPSCTLTASPASISAGGSSTLTASCSPAATSYIWAGGTCAGTNAASCTVTPSVTTAYTVAGINDAGTGAAATATVTVACAYSLTPISQIALASATTGTLSVASASGCAWSAVSNVSWITITSGSMGSGNGALDYAVAVNPSSSSRTGTLTVGGQTFTVTQAAGLVVPSCTLTALPGTITAGASAILTATCSPAATSYAWANTGFASTVSGGTVSPTVTVTYSVTGSNDAGTGNTASATVTVTPTSPPPDPNQPVAPPPATQTEYTVTTGVIPETVVSTVASGTLGSVTLNVTLNLSLLFPAGLFSGQGQFAAGYNVYVAALVPSGRLDLPIATWFMLPATPLFWTQFAIPIAAYLANVAQNASVPIGILQNMDMTQLLGTEFYIGYGLSDEEMLAAGRYRGVYIAR